MAFDPTISTGSILTMATLGGVLLRQSFIAGGYKREFEQVRGDLTEIKATLKEQDRASREQAKADALADGIIAVLQNRVMSLEGEMIRTRENIHRIAEAVQVEIARRGNGD